MKTKIIQVAAELMELHGRYTVFFDFAGHVETFYVRIYKGEWKSKKKAIYEESISFRRNNPAGRLEELRRRIAELKVYKPRAKKQ